MAYPDYESGGEPGGEPGGAGPDQDESTFIELTPAHRGRWLVHTVGSVHTFDLDRCRYTRERGSSRVRFEHDGREMVLTRWERWPKVGSTFFIWVDDPEVPELMEYWRVSSEVVSITPAPMLQDS